MNHSLPYIFLLLALAGCVRLEDAVETPRNEPKKMRFNVSVYRDGEQLTPERYGLMTKGTDVSVFDQFATMDPNREFGLIGFDPESGELLLDNHPVSHDGYNYSSWVGGNLWGGSTMVTLSAYYPYQSNVVYQDNNEAYSIPFSTEETEAIEEEIRKSMVYHRYQEAVINRYESACRDLGLSEEQKDWLLVLLMNEKNQVDEDLRNTGGGHI